MTLAKSPMNAIRNASNNAFQGKQKKVLTVCSAGLMRSPTLAYVLQKELGYNTRSCGAALDFCLAPISKALVAWADEIVFVDQFAYDYMSQEDHEFILGWGVEVTVLDIPDEYPWMDESLQKICLEQYMKS